MSNEKESSNPLAGIYGLGVIACTAIMYPQDGFWLSFGEALIWPVYVGFFIWQKMK